MEPSSKQIVLPMLVLPFDGGVLSVAPSKIKVFTLIQRDITEITSEVYECTLETSTENPFYSHFFKLRLTREKVDLIFKCESLILFKIGPINIASSEVREFTVSYYRGDDYPLSEAYECVLERVSKRFSRLYLGVKEITEIFTALPPEKFISNVDDECLGFKTSTRH